MKKMILLISLFIAGIIHAQQVTVSKNIRKAMNNIDTGIIRSHIAWLADDKLKGRLPGTEGYQMAVDYVTEQYRQLGLAPGGDNGTFLQNLVIRKSVLLNSSVNVLLTDFSGNTDTLEFLKDVTPVPHPLKTSSYAKGQIVFAGYGIEIPGGYSDYKNIDPGGKILVIVSGAPDGLHSTLTAHFSNMGNKINTARKKGAVGVILINLNPRPGTSPSATIQTNVSMNPGKIAAFGRGFTGNLPVALNSNRAILSRLLLQSGKKMETVLSQLKQGIPSSFELSLRLSVHYETTHTDFESQNVVAVIPGSDKELKNEYVVHSAHLDHVGIGRAVNGDSIYNGAHDNASGVASLLEIARIYKASGAKPKRSVLIVMVTGEEMGLIGSSYFAANPTVPKGSVVANINTDMPTVIAPLLSIVPLGAEHSSLIKNVEFAAKELGLEIEDDPEPNENRFIRSDQYSFVINGIPALHIKYGTKTNIPGFDLVEFVKKWRAKYYHQSADGMDGIFNFAAAKTYVQLNFLVSYSIAQTNQRPAWNKGDLFAAANE
ncbi:MAG TPA: M28 family peptidase [Chitinophagaceae bacterium]|nr:M28 family peptidase [Chitinophagaceae bacterium]